MEDKRTSHKLPDEQSPIPINNMAPSSSSLNKTNESEIEDMLTPFMKIASKPPDVDHVVVLDPNASVSERIVSEDQLEEIVTLNVGGKIHQTTLKTVMDSELLLNMYWISKLEKDNRPIFLDRDPTYFRFILNYLREGKLTGNISEYSQDTISNILNEANYFGLLKMINEIDEYRVRTTRFDVLSLEDCNLRHFNMEVVKKSEMGSLYCCLDYVLNKNMVSHCTNPFRYYVKFVLRYGDASNLAIGMTCKQKDDWKRFEVLKKIKQHDTIAIWYNYEKDRIVLYWNDVEVQRKSFKVGKYDWMFHVEMFPDDSFCSLKLIQTPHPSIGHK